MFIINSNDLADLRCQFGTLEYRAVYLPYVFTESGVAMLSGVLNSERAINVNISIMRTFSKMRGLLLRDEMLSKRMQELEKGTNKLFRSVFERLDMVQGEILEIKKDTPILPLKRKKIGLKEKD